MRKIEIYVGGYLRSTSRRNITMSRKSTVYVFGKTSVSKAAPGTITAPPRAYEGVWSNFMIAGQYENLVAVQPIRLPIPSDLMPEVGQLPPWRKQLPWLTEEICPRPDDECELCEPPARW
jgi:hypothetical protein